MIHAFGQPDPPVPRLLAALVERGHAVSSETAREERPVPSPVAGGTGRLHETSPASGDERRPGSTLVLASGRALDLAALGVLLGAWRSAPGARVLVLSRLGAHPDARAAGLRRLWQLEEHARACGLPVLTLRLGPLIGPRSPLWLKLRRRPRLPGGGQKLLNPVAEPDAVETLERALDGRAAWEGWYEVAGPELMSLAELASLAREAGPARPGERGAWEPPWRELSEHRIAESGGWLDHFSLRVRSIPEQVAQWAA